MAFSRPIEGFDSPMRYQSFYQPQICPKFFKNPYCVSSTMGHDAEIMRMRQALKIVLCLATLIFALGITFWFPPLQLFFLKHPGLIAVLVGVTGEVCFDWSEEKGPHKGWKRFFMILLVGGLAYELIEASWTDKEAADATKLAAYANERAALIESNNLVLRSNVDSLHLELATFPLRQRVSGITAIVSLTVLGTNDIRLPPWGTYSNTFAYMTLCDTAVTYSNSFRPPITTAFHNLEANDVETVDMDQGHHGYLILFHSAWDWKGMELLTHFDDPMTAGDAMHLIRGLRVDLKFLPHDSVIVEGTSKIIVNENNPETSKIFDIPPQAALEDAGAMGVWHNSQGFTLVATNWR